MDEAAREGEQPDDGQQDGKTSNDFSVNETALVPGRRATDGVEVVTSKTGNDGGKGELAVLMNHFC